MTAIEDKFGPETAAAIAQIKKLFENLPPEAQTFVANRIVDGCVRGSPGELSKTIASAIGADCLLVVWFRGDRHFVERGHANDASTASRAALEEASTAVKAVLGTAVSEGSGN